MLPVTTACAGMTSLPPRVSNSSRGSISNPPPSAPQEPMVAYPAYNQVYSHSHGVPVYGPGVYPTQYPGSPAQYPGSSAQYPGSSAQYPGSSAQYPGPPAQYPGSSAQYPGPPPQYSGLPPPVQAPGVTPVLVGHADQQPRPPLWSANGYDVADEKRVTEHIDIIIRHAFIRKIYGILSLQLLVTFGLACMFVFWKPASAWIIRNWWAGIVGAVLSLVFILVLTCVPGVARRHPINIIMLFLISLSFGVVLGFSSAVVGSFAFSLAAGITLAVTIGLTLFAFQTKWDFTGWGVFGFAAIIVLSIMSIVMIFVRNKIAHIVYASIGALVFSFYIVYDTQQIVGGKHHKFEYSIDDYVFAALSLYMDIINLFMYVLSIISSASGD